ncbi:MAG: tetratricopeptide repeat protein [Sulfuricella sp.]
MPDPIQKPIRITFILLSAALLMGSLTACGKSQTPQALVAEAEQLQQKGDIKAAIIQLKNALQQNPDDPKARYLLGEIYLKTEDPKSA